jgi:hypothetical protein
VVLTNRGSVVSFWANEEAIVASRFFHPRRFVLATGNIGVVDVADTVAGFIALPAGVYSNRSGPRINPCSAVLTGAIAWGEAILAVRSRLLLTPATTLDF